MNKLHDLTSNVDYIRELIEQYKRDVPESIIPLYYVTDDELTSILANYDSSESVDRKFDGYYSKEEMDELLNQKADFDTYTTDLQFNKNNSVLTLSRNDGQQFSTIIDTGQTPIESPLTVDLTNEIDSFPVNENGSTESSFDFSTSAHIYDGAQEQTITSCVTYVEEQGVSVQVSGVGTDEANISVHIDSGYSFSKNINVTISVACAKGTRAVLFTLIPLTSGKDGQSAVRYFLQPSATQIKINDDESYSDTTLTCDKMKQVGNGTPTITQDLILKMSIDGGAEQPYSTIVLASVKPTVKVQYSLYDTDNRLYDRETIVVVKNGKRGDKGDPGQKGDPGENHVVTYSIEFSQPLINEGATIVDINAYKIIDGVYQILSSPQCTVLGEQDAQGKIVTTGGGYFQLEVQDGFKSTSIYTVVLYINNNEEVARATLGVIKNRDTLFNLKNWSEVNIGDVCYSEDTLTSSTAISDVVVDDVYDSGKYLCIKTYRKVGNEDIYNTEYWQPFNEYKNVATDLLLADKAYIKNLLLNYATAIDSNGHETVSIDGETGQLVARKAKFEDVSVSGNIYTPYVSINSSNIDTYCTLQDGKYYVDLDKTGLNVSIEYAIPSQGGVIVNTIFHLPEDSKYLGAECNVINQAAGPTVFIDNVYDYYDYVNGAPRYRSTTPGLSLGVKMTLKCILYTDPLQHTTSYIWVPDGSTSLRGWHGDKLVALIPVSVDNLGGGDNWYVKANRGYWHATRLDVGKYFVYPDSTSPWIGDQANLAMTTIVAFGTGYAYEGDTISNYPVCATYIKRQKNSGNYGAVIQTTGNGVAKDGSFVMLVYSGVGGFV